jgi:hypothetical protein
MLALANPADIYRDSLLLSHLARSVASDACKVDASCNTAWANLTKYGDAKTQAQLDATFRRLTTAVGRSDLSAKQISALSPWDAAMEVWNVTGTVKTTDEGHVVATPEGHDPIVSEYIAAKRARASGWKFIMATTIATAAGIGIGLLASRRR